MRCAYFDCFSGAAGDMILAAMLDAGLDREALRAQILRLRLPGVELAVETVRRGGLRGTHLQVLASPETGHAHRHLPQILKIIAAAELPARAAERATRIFSRLAEAEATVHGVAVEQVHFHEVGAADAIVDIVGTCIGLELLGVERIICAPLPTGHGTVSCAHGVLPVPAPATAELLRGIPLADCDEPGELTTPTGAAILTTLADAFGGLPAMRITSIGYGAGTRENQNRPNLLRLVLGQLGNDPAPQPGQERVVVLETQIDDATGQAVAYATSRLLEAGALDAFTVPIVMKKGRPGQLLTVLCRPEDAAALEELLFRETTTFGVRRHECQRTVLERFHETVSTPFGPIRVKIGRRAGAVFQAWPEYEDCADAARSSGRPLREVQDAARRSWAERHGSAGSDG
jgi:uncharacterized protein (TIGR00299 family) protein